MPPALIGTVVDSSTQKPLANIIVTATAPQLMGEQVVITDSAGNYRIPQVPPGEYRLRFESENFEPHSQGGIHLRWAQTVRTDAALRRSA